MSNACISPCMSTFFSVKHIFKLFKKCPYLRIFHRIYLKYSIENATFEDELQSPMLQLCIDLSIYRRFLKASQVFTVLRSSLRL